MTVITKMCCTYISRDGHIFSTTSIAFTIAHYCVKKERLKRTVKYYSHKHYLNVGKNKNRVRNMSQNVSTLAFVNVRMTMDN